MKKMTILAVAVLLLALLVPLSARAQDEAPATPNVGYDKGFFIKNDEDTFKLKLNGRVQTKAFFQYQGGQPQQASFQMRRVQLNVGSTIHDVVSVGFTLQHAVSSAANTTFQTVNVAGASGTIQIVPALAVEVGMVGLALDLIGETSSAWLLMTEFPITSTQDDAGYTLTFVRPSFGAPEGLGASFAGGIGKWYYKLNVVNGTDSNYQVNPDRKMDVSFKTGVNILDPVPGSQTDFAHSETPQLTVNVGTMYQGKKWDAPATAVPAGTGAVFKYLWTSSLGVGFRYHGFAATAEGYYRRTRVLDPGTSQWARPRLTDIGGYLALGYYIIPKKLEIAAQGSAIIRQGPANDAYQGGAGINYYVFDNNLKLQLAYTLTKDYNDQGVLQGRKISNGALMATMLF